MAYRSLYEEMKGTGVGASKTDIYQLAPEALTLVDDRSSVLYDPRIWLPLRFALAISVAENGVLQPISFRRNGTSPNGTPRLEVTAGRQRTRTARAINALRAAVAASLDEPGAESESGLNEAVFAALCARLGFEAPGEGDLARLCGAVRRLAGDVRLKALQVVGDDARVLEISIAENAREDESVLSRAWKIAKGVAIDMDRERLRTAVRCSRPTFERYLRFAELTPEAQVAFDKAGLPLTAVDELVRLPQSQQVAAIERVAAAGKSIHKVREVVAAAAGGREPDLDRARRAMSRAKLVAWQESLDEHADDEAASLLSFLLDVALGNVTTTDDLARLGLAGDLDRLLPPWLRQDGSATAGTKRGRRHAVASRDEDAEGDEDEVGSKNSGRYSVLQ